MADLKPLIRLHKHELDEKRQALAALYGDMAILERERQALEEAFEKEKRAIAETGDIHFTFAQYTETVRRKKQALNDLEAVLEKKIEQAKDAMMETFSELKKYEMTQAERERLEAEERRIREGKIMDEIGLEGFRRKEE
jgi:flagellar FliJ protein